MQSSVSGFRLKVPSLENRVLQPSTMILLSGRPGVGKSVFAGQFIREGLQLGQHAIYVVTDTSGDQIRKKAAESSIGAQLQVVDLFLEKPHLINDISITVHQAIAKFSGQAVRLVFDSLSTLGMMFNPDVLPPWVLDQHARLTKNSANVLALMTYDTGIHPPSITRSLGVLSDIVLEMRLEESAEEPKRLFRIFSTRSVSHSAKWHAFTIDDAGLRFGEALS